MPPGTGSWEALAVLAGASVFGAGGLGWVCWVRSWCTGDNTCRAIDDGSRWSNIVCSFATNVPLYSDLLYHNQSVGNLPSLTRGVCGVGERFTLSSITGEPVCMLQRPYPDALDPEVMDLSAGPDHVRACGNWLSSGLAVQPSFLQSAEYFSFDDIGERAAAIRNAEAQIHGGSRLSATNLGKFRSACQRAVLAGSSALRVAGELAYTHLRDAAAIDSITDENSALQAVGVLMGHYCDAPVLMGWDYESAGFRTSVKRGTAFSQYAMSQALELVRASTVLQADAEAGNTHVNAMAFSTPYATLAQLTQVLRGATARTDDANAGLTIYEYEPELDGFIDLVNTNLAQAKGYLHGVAAMCSFSLQAIVATPGYTAAAHALDEWRTRQHANRPRGAALGQLHAPPNHEPLFEVEADAVRNASTLTISQLVSQDVSSLVGVETSEADAACRDFTRMMFPDEIDQIHHELVISPTLYNRMESIVAQARAGVAHVLRNNAAVRASLFDPDAVAIDVETTRIRIPGAARGTWAGATRALPVAQFDSTDGVFVMAAKQARSLFLDRQGSLNYDATDPCEGPAAYTPLTANAYIFPSYRCSYYLLGMSFRPYADEMYNDESLVSRFGYIISHELAHNNLNTPYGAGVDALLSRYPYTSTRNEGFADVLGTLGILQTGLVNSTEACLHISQAWCARVPMGYYGDYGQSHPQANTRGDCLCETLRDMSV